MTTDANGNGNALSRERIEARRRELRQELAAGEQRLGELAAEQSRVQDTVLRLDGAILAFSELLDDGPAPAQTARAEA